MKILKNYFHYKVNIYLDLRQNFKNKQFIQMLLIKNNNYLFIMEKLYLKLIDKIGNN